MPRRTFIRGGMVGLGLGVEETIRPAYSGDFEPLEKRGVDPAKRQAIFLVDRKAETIEPIQGASGMVIGTGIGAGVAANFSRNAREARDGRLTRKDFFIHSLIHAFEGFFAHQLLRTGKTIVEEEQARKALVNDLQDAGYQVHVTSDLARFNAFLQKARAQRDDDARTFVVINGHGGNYRSPFPIRMRANEGGKENTYIEFAGSFISDGKSEMPTKYLSATCSQIPGHVFVASNSCSFAQDELEMEIRRYSHPRLATFSVFANVSKRGQLSAGNQPLFDALRGGIRDQVDIRVGIKSAYKRMFDRLPLVARYFLRNNQPVFNGLVKPEWKGKNVTL